MMNPLVVDLSHWDPADNYALAKTAGIVGVIFKATDDLVYTDKTYLSQRDKAKAAGLKWGAYHFARSGDPVKQAENFLSFAKVGADDLFALDWENNPTGPTMTTGQAKAWIVEVEQRLGRVGQCVIYSGNVAKEQLGNRVDTFFGSRRLWLAQYGAVAHVQASWKTYWLWQYTDGKAGLNPHSIPGIGPCDINHFDGTPEQLRAEWASGKITPAVEPVPEQVVTITVKAPPGVKVVVQS